MPRWRRCRRRWSRLKRHWISTGPTSGSGLPTVLRRGDPPDASRIKLFRLSSSLGICRVLPSTTRNSSLTASSLHSSLHAAAVVDQHLEESDTAAGDEFTLRALMRLGALACSDSVTPAIVRPPCSVRSPVSTGAASLALSHTPTPVTRRGSAHAPFITPWEDRFPRGASGRTARRQIHNSEGAVGDPVLGGHPPASAGASALP